MSDEITTIETATHALRVRISNQCPDGGACHHWCGIECYRVHNCGPLSGVFPEDEWPKSVKADHGKE